MAAGGSQIRCRRFGSAEAQSWVFARASKFPGRNWFSLGFWLGEWAGEMALASASVPHQTELCRQGLSNYPSLCPPAFPLLEQSC